MPSSYKELIIWQKGIELVNEVYSLTSSFPQNEIHGLTSQMRRSAVSIPSNIAEGYGRGHSRMQQQDFVHFVRIAFASGAELETQVIIAKNLGFATEDKAKRIESILNDLMPMMNKFMSTLLARKK